MPPKSLFQVSEQLPGLIKSVMKARLFRLALIGMKQRRHLSRQSFQDAANSGKIVVPETFRS